MRCRLQAENLKPAQRNKQTHGTRSYRGTYASVRISPVGFAYRRSAVLHHVELVQRLHNHKGLQVLWQAAYESQDLAH